jgi:hypothetical protein
MDHVWIIYEMSEGRPVVAVFKDKNRAVTAALTRTQAEIDPDARRVPETDPDLGEVEYIANGSPELEGGVVYYVIAKHYLVDAED